MSPEDKEEWEADKAEWEEMVDNKATWQAECAAGVWFYYPVVPIEGQLVLLCTGNARDPWLAQRRGEKYVFFSDGSTAPSSMPTNSVWAWAYIQTPRKG